MRTVISYINNLIFPLIPESKGFGVKRFLWRLAGARIGKNVRICSSCKILGGGTLSIGDNTWIGHETMLVVSSNVAIGKNCDIAPRVFIGTGTHEITPTKDRIGGIEKSMDIRIGDGCWLCANTTILPGVVLGDKCVVAAGAVVVKSFPSYSLLTGLPAIRKRDLSTDKS